MRLTCRAPAKVNLYLRVMGRRADGMHLLDSLVAFCDLADTLAIEPNEQIALAVSGPFADQAGCSKANLVLRAARLLARETRTVRGALITLTKNIPVAAGLGGGSADAAAALRGLDAFWNTGCSAAQLLEYAEALGADVPVCIDCRPALMSGIGERLTPVETLPGCPVLLVHPRVPVPTANVFRAFAVGSSTERPNPLVRPAMLRANNPRELAAELTRRGNDLAAAAVSIAPVIEDAVAELAGLPGALYAAMSGSGATCFALFCDDISAARAADRIAATRPGWWRHAGRLSGSQDCLETASAAAHA